MPDLWAVVEGEEGGVRRTVGRLMFGVPIVVALVAFAVKVVPEGWQSAKAYPQEFMEGVRLGLGAILCVALAVWLLTGRRG